MFGRVPLLVPEGIILVTIPSFFFFCQDKRRSDTSLDSLCWEVRYYEDSAVLGVSFLYLSKSVPVFN